MSNKKQKKYNEMPFDYYSPEECTTPRQTRVAEILVDTDAYVLARIHYQNSPETSLAIRWHICEEKEEDRVRIGQRCIGYPNIFGRPTWFVLPDDLLMDIQGYLQSSDKK